MADLVVIRNPFDTRSRDAHRIAAGERTVEAIIGEYLPAGASDGTELIVSVNGHALAREDWRGRVIEADDQMIVGVRVQGGDDGILGAILSIALAVFAPYAAAWMGATFGTFGMATATFMAVATAGIQLVGSAIIGSLTAPDKPSLPAMQSFDTSPSYAWNPVTTQQPGGPIARAYGTVKLYGNVIGGYLSGVGTNGRDQMVDMLIDLGMGPFKQLSDFRINDQPIANFSGVQVYSRLGHLTQTYIPTFGNTRATESIAAKVEYDAPLVRTVAAGAQDMLEINLVAPNGLFVQNGSGGLNFKTVELVVEISADGGLNWDLVANETMTANQVQPVRRMVWTDDIARATEYQVRITRLTEDSDDSRTSDDIYLESIVSVLADDFTYPRTVLAAVRAVATEQLSGALRFSCLAQAAVVRVWNGTSWSSAWSDNPAWVCLDVLTQPVFDNDLNVLRYDGFDPARIDLAAFLAWAQWCDELVPDGAGGTEKRCLFNGVFDTQTSMWEAALEVANNARAVLLMRGTTVTVVHDHARAMPVQLFTVGNTLTGSFSETFLPMEDRAQAVEVDFVNAAADYQRDKVTVVDTGIAESAAQRVGIGLRGVTRASQAWREAMYRLKRNQLLTRTAQLSADIDAVACTVGDLVWVQNDVTRWGEGGRATGGSTTTVNLDKAITLAIGKTYELRIRFDDDTLYTRTIATPAGTVSTVTVSEAFPSAPPAYAPWAIGETGKAVKEFIVTDIARNGEQQATLGLVEYNASLYNVDTGEPTYPTPNLAYSAQPVISDLTIEEFMELAADGTVQVHLDVRFSVGDASYVDVNVAEQGKAVSQRVRTINGEARIANVTSGTTYTLYLIPHDMLRRRAPFAHWIGTTHAVVGKLAPPADVTSLTAVETAAGVRLEWGGVADLDLSHYEVRQGADYAGSVLLDEIDATSLLLDRLTAGTWRFWVAAVDTSGNKSQYPASAALVVPPPAVTSVALTESLALAAGAVVSRIRAVIASTDAEWFHVRWKPVDASEWTVIDHEDSSEFDIYADANRGQVLVEITPQRWFAGETFAAGIYLVGKSAPPADVAGLTFNAQRNQLSLSWNASEDLDVIVGGYLVLRYASAFDAAWDEAIDVTTLPGTSSSATLQSLPEGTWLARWLDSSGNYSATPAAVNVYSLPGTKRIDYLAQEPAWSGTKLNMTVVTDRLTLDGASASGYYRAPCFDYGAVCRADVSVGLTLSCYASSDTIDAKTQVVDLWPGIDAGAGIIIDDVSVSLWIRSTADDPAGSPAWTDWRRFYGQEFFSARAFQIELRAATGDLSHNVYVDAMGIYANAETKNLYAADVVSGAATKSVVYDESYVVAPAIGVMPQDMATGDYYEITNRSTSGFDITFKNSAGTAVSRTFDWLTTGY